MTLSRDHLLAIAQEYWDSSNDFLLKQEDSPARRRLQALWTHRLENIEPWNGFLTDLRDKLPNFIVGSTLTTGDACLRCIIYPLKETRTPSANWVVVGCVSILAPVYIVYGVECDYINGGLRNLKVSFDKPPPDMAFPASVVASQIETAFGSSLISRELAETPVPLFVNWEEPPRTTLFHALFTSEPRSIP